MFKRRTVGFVLLALMLFAAAQCGKRDEEVRTFAAQYKAIQEAYAERLSSANSPAEETEILKNKAKGLEELLVKYEKIPYSDSAELLKARLLVEISRFPEAGPIVDGLIERKSPLMVEAQMVKVHILVLSGEKDKGLALFKEIEPRLKEENDRFTGWLYMSLYSGDVQEIEVYSRKFLAAENLPAGLAGYRAELYWNLAALARENRDFTRAKDMLENALSASRDSKMKAALESELKQLEFIGRPALELSVDTWLNGSPISWGSLKGKAVVIIFWAPWCDSCRTLLPAAVKEYNTYKDKGLVVIGLTKLYGTYRDELEEKDSLEAKEEIDLLRQYIERNRITLPIALSEEGYSFEDYHITGIPTMIFIDSRGEVDDIIMGSRLTGVMGNKRKKLLEDSNGKN